MSYESPETMNGFHVPEGPITDPASRHDVLRHIDEFGLTEQSSVGKIRMIGFWTTMSCNNLDEELQYPAPATVVPLASHLGEGHPKLRRLMLREGAASGILHLEQPLPLRNLQDHYGEFIARAAIVTAWDEHLANLSNVSPVEPPDMENPQNVEQVIDSFIKRYVPSLPEA